MRKIIKLTALTMAVFVPQLVSAQATSPMKVSATVIPGCFIEADNINFGNLSMPLSDQSATGDIRVKCSKNSNLKISIEYGNNSSVGYTYSVNFTQANVQNLFIYNNGIVLGEVECNTNGNMYFSTLAVARYYGYNTSGVINRSSSVCNGGTVRTNNLTLLQLNGILNGASNGEQIKYSASHPINNNDWNSSNQHTFTSNGDTQNIQLKLNIKSSGNPTHRMTPDSYKDNLRVVLTY